MKTSKDKNRFRSETICYRGLRECLTGQETVSILENNKAALEKNLFETEKLYENGLGDEESVEQLQITLACIESALKNSIRFEDITLQTLNLSNGTAN